MGWFLTNATPRRSRKTSRRTERRPWDPKRTLRGLKALGVAAAVGGLIAAWAYGERALRAYVAQRTAKPVLHERIELAETPRWMSPALARELRTAVAFELGEDPLDGQSLQHAAKALSASPWVAQVQRIERLPGGRARVHAHYRRPVAVVETDHGYQMVDPQGVVLPQTYRVQELAAVGLMPIEGVLAPPPRAGTRWDDPQLDAALAVLRLLEPQPWYSQVKSIDASGRDTRGRIRLVLHTARGQITWGLPPGQEQPVEPAAATKLQWLHQIYAGSHQRAIDAGGKTIDIYSAAAWERAQP